MNNSEHPIVAISVSKKFSNRSYHQKHKRSRKTVLLSFVKSNWNKSGMSKHNRTILTTTPHYKRIFTVRKRKKLGQQYIVIFRYLWISLLDNAPNLVVGCIIQKRMLLSILFFNSNCFLIPFFKVMSMIPSRNFVDFNSYLYQQQMYIVS